MTIFKVMVECRKLKNDRYVCQKVLVPAKDRYLAAQAAIDTFNPNYAIVIVRVIASAPVIDNAPIKWIAFRSQTKVKADGTVIQEGAL